MTLRQYLTVMSIGTLACLLALGLVLFRIDPFQDGGLGFFFFYTSFFLSSVGFCSTLAFLVYFFFLKSDIPPFQLVQRTFLAALGIAGIATFLLLLQARAVLNWWNVLTFLGIVIFLLLFRFSLHLSKQQEAR